jgi:signal transduction histidine kinase
MRENKMEMAESHALRATFLAPFRYPRQNGAAMRNGLTLRRWMLGFGGWTAVGLAFGAQLHFASAAFDRPIPWTRAVSIGLRDWYLWALMSLVIWKLVKRYPLERRTFWKQLAIYIASCVAAVMVYEVIGVLLSVWFPAVFGIDELTGGRPPGNAGESSRFSSLLFPTLSFKAAPDTIMFWVLVLGCYAFNSYQRLQERDRVEAELKSSLTEARLRALKMQLQPHFLFNTLNAIAALIRQNPKTAEMMIGSLSELLRTTLDLADRQEVTLREELEFINCYLGIEQLRFGDRLAVRSDIDTSVRDVMVPSMILQPIVENAVRHAVEPNLADSVLAIIARREGEELRVVVQDNGPGFGEAIPEGIGLQNTRSRLHQLYAGQERLVCEPAEHGGAKVTLLLPFRRLQSPVASAPPGATETFTPKPRIDETASSGC